MTVKIDGKIVGYSVKKPEDTEQPKEAEPVKKKSIKEVFPTEMKKLKRPSKLSGDTYKIKNGADNFNLYVCINYLDGEPFELFFNSSHTESEEWAKAVSRLVSAMLRNPEYSLEFIAEELIKVTGSKGYFAGKDFKYVGGMVQHIGRLLLKISRDGRSGKKELTAEEVESVELDEPKSKGEPCPECSSDMQLMDGCWSCPSCGWSKCS